MIPFDYYSKFDGMNEIRDNKWFCVDIDKDDDHDNDDNDVIIGFVDDDDDEFDEADEVDHSEDNSGFIKQKLRGI